MKMLKIPVTVGRESRKKIRSGKGRVQKKKKLVEFSTNIFFFFLNPSQGKRIFGKNSKKLWGR